MLRRSHAISMETCKFYRWQHYAKLGHLKDEDVTSFFTIYNTEQSSEGGGRDTKVLKGRKLVRDEGYERNYTPVQLVSRVMTAFM